MNQERYDELKAIVAKHKQSVAEWAEALREIKSSGKWKKEAPNWEIWCLENAGITAAALRMQESRERKKLTSPAPPEKESERNALPSKPNATQTEDKPKTITVSARVDQTARVPEMHKPAEIPAEIPRVQKLSVEQRLGEVQRGLDRLSHEQLSVDNLRLVCHLLSEIKQVRQLLQPSLPMEVESSKKRSKGTLEECITYCKLKGLLQSDGEWFFHKCVGAGWKNNGQPINDWQATVNAWQLSRVFPSQKGGSYQTGTRNSGTGQSNPGRNEGTFNKNPSQYRDVGRVA